MRKKQQQLFSGRFYFLIFLLCLIFVGLIFRMLDLNVFKHTFLQRQSNSRAIRVISIPAHRGMIIDRNNEPLAISTPVDSVWVNPQITHVTPEQLTKLGHILHIPYSVLSRKVDKHNGRWFVYLRRRIDPAVANKVRALKVSGIFFQREYRRFYPEAEVDAHVLGFTNIDDVGQEGLELAYNSWLKGVPGKKKVLKDRMGHVIADFGDIKKPQPGHNLQVSIDDRIQYLAYRELKRIFEKYHAESGSIVVLDVKTGEILAMVNQPSFNPNNRPADTDGRYRNRAVTDVFEPGSTMKAFSIASALESGKYTPLTKVDTNPGWMVVDGNTINDEHINHGVLTVTGVLQKSSNIGVAKMTLSLPAEHLWLVLHKMGFGEITGGGFPGEVPGILVNHRVWRPFVLATLAFGYGLSVTPLQLAGAYAVIANNGIKMPLSFLKVVQNNLPQGERVMKVRVARQMAVMLESVVANGGTGTRAQVPGYRVAGKTGTAYIAGKHGYNKKNHIASFVGMAPVSNPRLVVAVIVRNPHGQHFGGLVAAPAFAHVMGGALRLMGVAPDNLS